MLKWQVYVARDTGQSESHPPGGFHYEQPISTSFDAYGLKHGEIKIYKKSTRSKIDYYSMYHVTLDYTIVTIG